MQVNLYPLIRGLISYGIPRKYLLKPGSGGTFSSKYCYSVWLRHLIHLFHKGLLTDLKQIKRIAEIGPGDSLGIGIAGLLTGASEYYAFDVIEHANLDKNWQIAEELATFFKERSEIPHRGRQFSNTKPVLDNYEFPREILGGRNIEETQLSAKLEHIKKALLGQTSKVMIKYIVPWYEKKYDLHGKIDLIYSQAVMEHVDDLEHAYSTMYEWLKPGGIISHQIDFKAHEMTKEWNGHWYINQGLWNILLHGRKYSINRLPLSAHLKEIEKAGFSIKNIIPFKQENPFEGKKPRINKCTFTDEDMVTSSALVQAVK